MIIDDNKQLTTKAIKQFASLVNDTDKISFCIGNCFIKDSFKNNFVDNIFNAYVVVADNADCSFCTQKDSIRFDGANFNWWKKTKKRLEKFNMLLNNTSIDKKDETKIVKTTKKKDIKLDNEENYSVAVAYCIDEYLSKIDFFEGPKSKAIDFINNDIFDKLTATSIDTKVVVNLAFDKDEFNHVFNEGTEEEKEKYRHNLDMWYTLRELEDIGALTLR